MQTDPTLGHLSTHDLKAIIKAASSSAVTSGLAPAARGGYSAPMTVKSWLTKTWCGQLTPM